MIYIVQIHVNEQPCKFPREHKYHVKTVVKILLSHLFSVASSKSPLQCKSVSLLRVGRNAMFIVPTDL